MAEIHLPTKVTQDSIKQDTADILGNFPISGGTDFLEGIFGSLGTSGTHEGATLLDIEGKGIITTLINGNNHSDGARFRVQIDGGAVIEVNVSAKTSVSAFIPFNNSVKITVQHISGRDITYLLF